MPKWIAVSFSLLILLACQPPRGDDSMLVLYQQPALAVRLSPATAPVETPLQITVQSEQPVTAISAELTGVSMYMGLIPLRFQKLSTDDSAGSEQWQAVFLLGACADPAMIWQLNLTLQLADGQKLLINERFNSSW
ncbi:MAG: hypothetical protein CML20_13970 [Rheinheimera sp.]|uniref:hypothetical protein n=1 Tax=Arsukibacterium sp. UBA3155 TaxID=1946058 RepID=UPI000C923BE4|nr:hypothetical protein [Arsukibacterium sp. UBA3155]MAD75868.1 hypothetical protein [Rheinheimera sp.]|tara:strand:- start:27483 stop:27890 length:408 start_codon:yes stop_codon:yes gene_type:complete